MLANLRSSGRQRALLALATFAANPD